MRLSSVLIIVHPSQGLVLLAGEIQIYLWYSKRTVTPYGSGR